MASIHNGKGCSSMKTIIAISVISMLALGMSILTTRAFAQSGAYNKGYNDALCDAALCNGHGYDPRCPGDHSSEYCNNYRDGYSAGWDASTSANNNENSQSGSGDGGSAGSQSQSQTTPDINIHIGPQSQAQSQSQASGN
ncbi:MAG: hypothetical protein WA395_09675 [Nitrososphaeraceae archaeon]